jgi:hypothetical protein
MAHLVLQELMEQVASVGLLVPVVHQVRVVHQGLMGLQVQVAHQGLMGLQVRQEFLVPVVQMELLGLMALQVRVEYPVLLARLE